MTDALSAALTDGTFLDAAIARLAALPEVLLTLATLNWGYAFAAFCLGLVACRRRLLADLEHNRDRWRRLAVIGLSVGLPVQCVAAWLQVTSLGTGQGSSQVNVVGTALGFATAPLLSAGYVGALALLCIDRPNALAWTRPAGRVSLSLYIGESVVLSLVFSGYGLGLFGRVEAAGVTVIAVATWAGLEVLGRLWLSRMRQGPLEALVTRVTTSAVAGPRA